MVVTNGNGAAEPAARSADFDDHPCLSALASCSGLVPCEPCRMALAKYVVAKALLAAECGTAEQVTAFLDAFAKAQGDLVISIRNAAAKHQAEQARTLEATREALKAPAPAAASQTKPVKSVKKKPAVAVEEASETLDELFGKAVSVAPPPPDPDPAPAKASDSPVRKPINPTVTEKKKASL